MPHDDLHDNPHYVHPHPESDVPAPEGTADPLTPSGAHAIASRLVDALPEGVVGVIFDEQHAHLAGAVAALGVKSLVLRESDRDHGTRSRLEGLDGLLGGDDD